MPGTAGPAGKGHGASVLPFPIRSGGSRVSKQDTRQKGDGMAGRRERRRLHLGDAAGGCHEEVTCGLRLERERKSQAQKDLGEEVLGREVTCAEAPRRGTACCDPEE